MTKTLFEYTALGRLLSAPAHWLLRAAGWRIQGAPPDLPKYIVVAAPHTTNWDFLIMVGVVLAVQVPIHWLGKHTIFRKPLGAIFVRLGGIPIDRSKAGNVVEQLISVFAASDRFVLIIAPEGSRKQVGRWKSGFYHIAKGAHVPLILATLDYTHRIVNIETVVYPTDDAKADAERIMAFYAAVAGRYPQEMGTLDLGG
jgi:1-acyl-sn-glycerol-3-phosphate acyltransferase